MPRKPQRAAKPPRFAIIVSRFNEAVTDDLLKGARQRLRRRGLPDGAIETIRVPGAFEIPAAAGKLARSGRYAGLICLGAVIRGETPHFEYISRAVSQTLCRIASESGLALGFGILTTETLEQAEARADPSRMDRGGAAAETALEMARLLARLPG
jgi:6,7-dimethyl-8-ribityllumazine synthase